MKQHIESTLNIKLEFRNRHASVQLLTVTGLKLRAVINAAEVQDHGIHPEHILL